MSKKTRTQQTPEEKKKYWLTRLVKKANTIFPQFQKDIAELVEMAEHATLDDKERSGIRSMIIDQTLQITNKLAVAKQDDYNPATAPKEPYVPTPDHA